MERTPLWLDVDTGHDDAFAILLAAHHPSLRLVGISTVHGNASLEQTTANTLSILTAIGKPDIPVHPGARKPFCRSSVHAPEIHGQTGLDGTTCLPAPSARPITEPNAILAMRNALMKEPGGTAWLVTTGALTNAAQLFATFPELVDHIKGLSIMGGAIGAGFTDAPMGHVRGEGVRFGNQTRYAEFNIYCDPEAAKSIFSNPKLAAKTTLITLDLTHQVLANLEVQQLLAGNPLEDSAPVIKLRELFHEILLFFAHTYRDVFGLTKGPPLHDPLAVSVLLNPGLGLFFDEGERWDIDIVTDGVHSNDYDEQGELGRVIAAEAEVGVRIPRAVNVNRFWTVVESCMQNAAVAVSS